MKRGLIDTAAKAEDAKDDRIFGTVLGVVVNNVDLCGLARVQVRIPSLNMSPWARVTGTDNGTFFMPQIGDEVTVSFCNGDPAEPLVTGAVWNDVARPPTLNPLDAVTKRIMKSFLGNKIEFDDATQTTSIETSTKQQVTLDPAKIELSTTGGAARVTLYATGDVEIVAAKSISFNAPTIKITGGTIEINGAASTAIKGGALCSVDAALVTIN